MKRTYLVNLLLGTINLAFLVLASANEEPFTPLPSAEVELTESLPTVKDITVSISQTVKETAGIEIIQALETVQFMVQDILNHSKVGVVKLPISDGCSITPAMKIAQHLEIVISTTEPQESKRPEQVSITLQEQELQSTSQWFDYHLDNSEQLYQNLKNYLTEYLNLQPKTATTKVATTPVTPSTLKQQPVSPLLTTPSQPPPVAKSLISSSQTDHNPGPISPEQEVQLKNMSPAIKNISIKLQGTEREKEELEMVQTMVNEILHSSKLEVVRIPVPNEPVLTPVIKVYENLEIVIGIKSPQQTEQPYQVSITLQEEGTQGEAQLFKYYPYKKHLFLNELKDYLTEHLQLQPRPSN